MSYPALLPSSIGPVPTLVGNAGERAGRRFLEFFAAAIRNPHTRRAYARATTDFLAWCEAAGIASAVYYPRPLHRTTAFGGYPTAPGGLPVSERLAEQVLSIPMHPYLDETAATRVAAAIRRASPTAPVGG